MYVALFILGAPVTSALAQFSANEKMKRNVSFLCEGKPVQVFRQPCLFALPLEGGILFFPSTSLWSQQAQSTLI